MSDFGGINVTNEICEITCIHEEQVTNSKKRLKNTNSKDLSWGARINGTEIPIGIFMKIRKRLYVDI